MIESNDWDRIRPVLVAVEDLELRLDDVEASPIYRFMCDRGYRPSSHVVLTSVYIEAR